MACSQTMARNVQEWLVSPTCDFAETLNLLGGGWPEEIGLDRADEV